jgi:hypothetical protein
MRMATRSNSLGGAGCSIPLDYEKSELCEIMLKVILIDRNGVYGESVRSKHPIWNVRQKNFGLITHWGEIKQKFFHLNPY